MEYNQIEISDEERRKAKDRMCGRAKGTEALLIVCAIILFAALACFMCMWIYISEEMEAKEVYLIPAFMIIMCGGVIALLLFILFGYYRTVRQLKDKYDRLPTWRKEHLLMASAKYTPKSGLLYDEYYLYGEMAPGKGKNGKHHGMRCFYYFDYRDIQRVHVIQMNMALPNIYGMMATSMRVQKADVVRIYLTSGKWLDAPVGVMDSALIFNAIQAKNPGCRIG